MSENLERVQLSDEIVETVAGGKVVYRANRNGGSYLWSKPNPDVKYAFDFDNLTEIVLYLHGEAVGQDDQVTINYLLSKHLITPM